MFLVIFFVVAAVTGVGIGDASIVTSYTTPLHTDLLDYFRIRNRDGLLVKWAHAVNSRAKLDRALRDEKLHMIECDVTLDSSGSLIMAHPPENRSDLTFQALLEAVTADKNSPKGLKLDFKADAAVLPALRLLRQYNDAAKLRAPLMLNADVLPGPGGSRRPAVNATGFLEACGQWMPQATLSIGWTTGDGSAADGVKLMNYTPEMADDMLSLIDRFRPSSVTYPVSARHLSNSFDAFKMLLHQQTVGNATSGGTKSTLTVWSYFGEALARLSKQQRRETVVELRAMRRVFDLSRVYYDLDPSLQMALTDDSAALRSSRSIIVLSCTVLAFLHVVDLS